MLAIQFIFNFAYFVLTDECWRYLGVSYALGSSGQISVAMSAADVGWGVGSCGCAAAACAAHHAGITAAVSADCAGARHAPSPAITRHAGPLPRTVLTDVAPHLSPPETFKENKFWRDLEWEQEHFVSCLNFGFKTFRKFTMCNSLPVWVFHLSGSSVQWWTRCLSAISVHSGRLSLWYQAAPEVPSLCLLSDSNIQYIPPENTNKQWFDSKEMTV